MGKSFCQVAEVSNCIEYLNPKECLQCEEGYMLNLGNQCVLEKISKVSHCRIYKDLQNCSECVQGYFVNGGLCQPVSTVANCFKYSGVNGTCVECTSDFFLDINTTNTCIQRNVSIDIVNCEQNKIDSDSCFSCVLDYDLTQNDTVCVPKVIDCLEYIVTSVDPSGNHQYKCDKCISKYYLDITGNNGVGLCLQGTINNCDTYTKDANQCVECEFQYYLNSPTECLQSNPNNISPNCTRTDSTKPDSCLECASNYKLIHRATECQLAGPYQSLTNTEESRCTEWANPTQCISCEPMFYGQQCENETT